MHRGSDCPHRTAPGSLELSNRGVLEIGELGVVVARFTKPIAEQGQGFGDDLVAVVAPKGPHTIETHPANVFALHKVRYTRF